MVNHCSHKYRDLYMTFSQCLALDSSSMSFRDGALGIQNVPETPLTYPTAKSCCPTSIGHPVLLYSQAPLPLLCPGVPTTSVLSKQMISSLLRKLRSLRASTFIFLILSIHQCLSSFLLLQRRCL